tara:strand:- start:207 stop:965 length:759 start_codon:yes stop_codon:yes gene_type:complete
MIDNEERILADKLKELRVSTGISQKDLAEALDVSILTISSIEGHKRPVSLPLLRSYSFYFNLNLSTFFDDTIDTSENSLNYEFEIENIKKKLLNILPIQIPCYSHRELFNPKFPKQESIAYALRSGDYYSNQGKDLYMIQVQTNNLYPDILANDRIIVDPKLPVDTGIGIVYKKNYKREHFNNESGAMIIRFEKTQSGKILYANNFTKNHLLTPIKRELKENEYKGMVIQIIRPILVKGVNTTYKDLPIGQA